jgi:succinate dehydrogenase/fumarate reductase cytochrome b subunit
MEHPQESYDIGIWPWLLQRVTGPALLIFLGVHMYVTHFGGFHLLTFDIIADRFRNAPLFWTGFDGLFLIFAVFHSLNGIRTIIFDFRLGPRLRLIATAIMWIIGLIIIVLGLGILVPYSKAGG